MPLSPATSPHDRMVLCAGASIIGGEPPALTLTFIDAVSGDDVHLRLQPETAREVIAGLQWALDQFAERQSRNGGTDSDAAGMFALTGQESRPRAKAFAAASADVKNPST